MNKYSDDTILVSVQFLHTAFTEQEVRSWLNGHCRIIEMSSGHGSTPGKPPGVGGGGSSLMASSGQYFSHSLMVREDGGQCISRSLTVREDGGQCLNHSLIVREDGGQHLSRSLMVREDGGQCRNCFLTHSTARRTNGRLLICLSVE